MDKLGWRNGLDQRPSSAVAGRFPGLPTWSQQIPRLLHNNRERKWSWLCMNWGLLDGWLGPEEQCSRPNICPSGRWQRRPSSRCNTGWSLLKHEREHTTAVHCYSARPASRPASPPQTEDSSEEGQQNLSRWVKSPRSGVTAEVQSLEMALQLTRRNNDWSS